MNRAFSTYFEANPVYVASTEKALIGSPASDRRALAAAGLAAPARAGGRVSGTVTSSSGKKLAGICVEISTGSAAIGTGIGTATGRGGRYNHEVDDLSCVGGQDASIVSMLPLRPQDSGVEMGRGREACANAVQVVSGDWDDVGGNDAQAVRINEADVSDNHGSLAGVR